MELTIWTLNRCTELLAGEDKRIKRIFAPHRVSFGERNNPNDSRRQLMPEIEYFVPIPLKCIGSKRSPGGDASGQKLLGEICDRYSYLKNDDEFNSWWKDDRRRIAAAVEHRFGRPHMTTPPGIGYYQLLEQHPNNILIGYSLGGLVARYLAFLDRHVFKRNIIAAVFTVSSPNWGSPLANPANKDSVAEGLVEFFVTMGSFHAEQFGTVYTLIDNGVHFDPIYKTIAAAEQDSRKSNHPAADALATAVKWLSGLEGDPNNAFAEIGIEKFNDPYSVLSLANDSSYRPAGVYTGCVVSANPDFDEILRSIVIGGGAKGLFGRIVQCLKAIVLWFVRRVKIFGFSMGANELAAGRLYATRVMVENPNTLTPIGQRLQTEYGRNETVLKPIGRIRTIPAYSHDFIIPSVYQLLADDDRFLGHYVNPHASHNSGKSQDYPAGRENVRALRQLMKELAGKI